MEAASSSVTSVSSAQLSANQLPTFVTQPNTSHTSKQVSALPTASGNQQNEGMHHVTSTGAPIMVIQQPDVASAVGLVAASAPSTQGMPGVAVQAATEQPQMGGLYTSATGLPAEYVIPGTNMMAQAAQPFHVHVPVMHQQEGGSEESSGYHEMDEDGRGGDKDELREQDRFLPIANVARIMKKGVPKQGKIAKDAKECVQECVSEFISFITSEASERCQQEKRKTINGEDILFAMSTLGFDNYVDPLKQYLTKYREAMKGEKGAMNTSTDTVRSEVDQSMDEGSESNSQPMSFQVPGTAIHPSMVTGEQPPSTIYTYPAQLQPQALHFQ